MAVNGEKASSHKQYKALGGEGPWHQTQPGGGDVSELCWIFGHWDVLEVGGSLCKRSAAGFSVHGNGCAPRSSGGTGSRAAARSQPLSPHQPLWQESGGWKCLTPFPSPPKMEFPSAGGGSGQLYCYRQVGSESGNPLRCGNGGSSAGLAALALCLGVPFLPCLNTP